MNDIGKQLKELREQNNLTRKEAVDKLREHGIDISDKTLYGYESGRNSANADMFLALCKIYKCNNIMETFSDTVEEVLFTNIEWNIIEKYRDLDDRGKEHVNSVLGWEIERTKLIADKDTQLSDLHQQLNIRKLQSRLRLYTYMDKIACAGTGFYFDDIPTDTLEAPYMKGADFIIGVSGDSMEPNYHDGERLYVQKVKKLTLGDVGIFTIHNECFVKELGELGLISRNPEYEDIKGTEDVRLIGRVLGKVEE